MSAGLLEQPAALVLTGVMAAGKSTVAQALCRRLPRAAHVRGDVFRRMIVAGGAAMTPELEPAAVEQLQLRYRLAAAVTDEYVRAGFTTVVQDVLLDRHLSDFVDLLRSRPVFVVVLAPRPDVVAAREAGREKVGYGAWTVADLDQGLRSTARLGLWLDTSDQTPEQSVDELTRRLPEARVRL